MQIAHEERRRKAERIWWAGVRAVQPANCVSAAMESLQAKVQDWRSDRDYRIIGGGKAGAAMAQAAEAWLLKHGVPPERIAGWVNVPEGSQPGRLERVMLHPARPAAVNFPTPAAAEGTLRMLALVDQAPDDALMLCLISGGGSALLTAPVPEVPLADKVQVSRQLSAAGASIEQLNAVRKHLSQIKGGGLAARCFAGAGQRQLVSLIISDVIGDPLDVIASGPTAPDPTTFQDALRVLEELDVRRNAPASVVAYLEAGARGERPETLKKVPHPEPRLMHRIIANNRIALDAARREAVSLGYQVLDLGDWLAGDTQELARNFLREFLVWRRHRPVCILSGGETTVCLPPQPGKGGRNQTMALAMLSKLGAVGLENVTLLCGGTDGEDGPTDAAGAFADAEIIERSQSLGLDAQDYLTRQDAYPFFEAAGGLFKTRLTETNVMDLRVFLID
jgi:glycerate 2-kinase